MLIAALEIQVARPGVIAPFPEQGQIGDPGLEPDVDDFIARHELMPATLRTLGTVGQLPEGLPLEPGVAAAIAEQLGGAPDKSGVDDLAAAGGAERERQRHTPDTLPGDAPVGTRLDHAADAQGDRKSTRLNSSHLVISYAV